MTAPVTVMRWARTGIISIEQNTSTRFRARLHDNCGAFRCDVSQVGDDLLVRMSGCADRVVSPDFARWEWSAIWDDLAKQGHAVQILETTQETQ